MRRRTQLRLTSALALLLGAISASAADRCGGQAVPPEAAGAVHVSPAGQDGPGCGSASSPCRTLELIQSRGLLTSTPILLHVGVYTLQAPLVIEPSIRILGGCVFNEEADSPYRTEIRGTIKLLGTGDYGGFWMRNIVVRAAPATAPGGASVALVINKAKGLSLTQVTAIGNRGADGPAGITPAQAYPGDSGNRPLDSVTGGAGAVGCGVSSGNQGAGGKGADYNNLRSYGCVGLCGCDNNSYSVAQTGFAAGSAAGGRGGPNGQSGCMCADGTRADSQDGGTGYTGAEGTAGTTGGTANSNLTGTFSDNIWQPLAKAGAGASGSLGAGGGGGGAGGYMHNIDNIGDYPGLPGGGGGAGGCGGSGGGGGGMGGASIAMVLATDDSTNPSFTQLTLIPGRAGDGGAGGHGAQGGSGGSGGYGFHAKYKIHVSTISCSGDGSGDGGMGGSGGQGGPGAGGAGGNGGPAMAMAVLGIEVPYQNQILSFSPPSPSAAGVPGAGAQNAANDVTAPAGAPGLPGQVSQFAYYPAVGHRPLPQKGQL